ncbi:tripartite tricarboxylate transporter substrate binding protein [Corticibacter populi]|uniref:Tripartite tricarboxylate transporter substrate binding protein n=1 Tax=Corticibacter populi TaxID=1550736 RepID=A0A3M6QPC3_9BURK|nr:tripartite tricarboxylate transporter substrate binding protein [Corticibacter populi]RMX04910.1 tripartite tricarboxylate transporter substrate binding protein [Corticibacter populi]RZS33665.1 tripartite-type tricarboxylate transporter receptor subunit TctC [Corticibacter populi]
MFKKLLAGLAMMGLGITAAMAQGAGANWPTKPIRMIVPFPPGGGTDILARLVSAKLGEANGWTIVADNKPGVGGTLGITELVRAAPAGYDIALGQKDNLVIGPWLYKSLTWNPVNDLTAVAHVAYSPVLISTSAQSPYKTLADVVTAAKARPTAVTYGSPGNGTSIHLAAHLFEQAAGVQLTHIPYRGSNPALVDVLAGNVDLLVSSVPSAIGQINSGNLRPLAVTSARRSSSLPDVPTIAESGIEGVGDFDVSTWYGMVAPAGTPAEVVRALNTQVNALLATPEMQKAIQAQGAEPLAMTQTEFATFLQQDYEAWRGIVESSGVAID